jgi:hypothetical protein
LVSKADESKVLSFSPRPKCDHRLNHARQDIAEVTSDLWDYYQELKAYQQQPTTEEREHLDRHFDEIFGRGSNDGRTLGGD